MKRMVTAMLLTMAINLGVAAQNAADKHDDMKDCPMHAKHQAVSGHSHGKQELDKRGDQGMGFSQEKTTHHFLLFKDGGAIQVTANSAEDRDSLEAIRMHLGHIAQAFQSGDFSIPMFVHDQAPPGVPEMTKLKEHIHYKYESVENGGRVLISSDNPAAIAAVHEFLKFQITGHQTGDALEAK